MEKEITIFICENREVSREILGKYLKNGEVTYAEMLPAENREKIVDFLKRIEEPFVKLINKNKEELENLIIRLILADRRDKWTIPAISRKYDLTIQEVKEILL